MRSQAAQTEDAKKTHDLMKEGIITVGPVLGEQAKDSERSRLVMALEKCGWVKAKAARHLGITPRQLGYALQKLQIEVKKY